MAKRPFRFIAQDFEEAVGLAAEEASRDVVILMKKLSSGTLTRAQAASEPLNHPFARKHGFARADPAIINVLTGRFRAGWKFKRLGPGRYVVYNDSEVAKYLEPGTKGFKARSGLGKGAGPNSGMVARPINATPRCSAPDPNNQRACALPTTALRFRLE